MILPEEMEGVARRAAREADDDVADILEAESAKGAFPFVLHCFTAGPELARRALALGGYISFSGVLTFKNSTALREIAAGVPADRMLVETDAPFLTPHPYRGQPNQSYCLPYTARALAAVRGVADEEMARILGANARRVYGIPLP